jgi:hypothetical protein
MSIPPLHHYLTTAALHPLFPALRGVNHMYGCYPGGHSAVKPVLLKQTATERFMAGYRMHGPLLVKTSGDGDMTRGTCWMRNIQSVEAAVMEVCAVSSTLYMTSVILAFPPWWQN